jgi:hypothetical protein
MTSCGNTGPTVPCWIREQVAGLEASWPPLLLCVGAVATIVIQLVLAGILWTSNASVFYGSP